MTITPRLTTACNARRHAARQLTTNESAVALWKKCGFSIVGTLPRAYRHRELGLVDAYVMHRFL